MIKTLTLLIIVAGITPVFAQDDFAANAWMNVAEILWADSIWLADYDVANAISRELAWELNEASGWLEACREWWEDPSFEDDETGMMSRHLLGNDRVLIEVTCSFGAYQGNFALVLIAGNEAVLLRYPDVGVDGELLPSHAAIHSGDANFEEGGRDTFSVYERGRGIGGCGTYVTYQIDDTAVEPVQAQAQDCDAQCENEECLDPRTWPIVYTGK